MRCSADASERAHMLVTTPAALTMTLSEDVEERRAADMLIKSASKNVEWLSRSSDCKNVTDLRFENGGNGGGS